MLKINNPWVVCLVAASMFFYMYIQIIMFNVIQPDLIVRFNADSTTLSFISSLYFYGNMLLSIPGGIILDYFSTRKILVSAMFITMFGLYLFSYTDSILIAGIGRFIVGVSGGTFCFIGTLRLCNRWFPENRMAFVTGLVVSIGMVGGIIGLTPFAKIIEIAGFDTAIHLNFALGLFITLLIFIFVHDYPTHKKEEYFRQINLNRQHGYINQIKTVAINPQNWYASLCASLLNMPMQILGALWGMAYLTQVYSLSKIQASITCAAILFGMIVGAPLFGVISDKIHLRKLPIYMGAVISIIPITIVLLNNHLSFNILTILFFLIGLGISAQCIVYPIITEINPIALSGSVLGLSGMIIMAGGAIFQPLVGWLIELNWDGRTFNSLPVYSSRDYLLGLIVIPISMLAAAGFLHLVKETRCRRHN